MAEPTPNLNTPALKHSLQDPHIVVIGAGMGWYLDKHGVPVSWPWFQAHFDAEMAASKLEAYDVVPKG